jgi:hypothetical protein
MVADLRNATGSREPPITPMKADGTPFRFEMIYAGGYRRCYADTHLELVAALIPGYDELDRAPGWSHGPHPHARLHP